MTDQTPSPEAEPQGTPTSATRPSPETVAAAYTALQQLALDESQPGSVRLKAAQTILERASAGLTLEELLAPTPLGQSHSLLPDSDSRLPE